MARELELKFRVRDREAVLLGLKEHGFELSPPVRQLDQAYAPRSWRESDARIGITFVRLRTVGTTHTLTTKTPVTGVLDCEEHETEVGDPEQMHAVLLAMGYRPTVTIDKTRQTAALGPVSVCLDTVAGLGDFLEVEFLSEDAAGPVDREAALWRAVPDAIDPSDQITVGYDSLVRQQPPAAGTARG